MDGYRRYAVYWVPEADSPLGKVGARWLGWDAASASERAHPDLPVDLATITATPRKYGLHGTLKPPFHLAEGRDVHGLDQALSDITDTLRAFDLTGLSPRALGGFLALTPDEASEDLAQLAGTLVTELDLFRAPPDAAELARRRERPLSPEQEANLTRWGYPHVLDQFRFHVTLSGRLDEATRAEVLPVAETHFATALPRPFPIQEIALCGEREDKRFAILKRYRLLS